MKWTADQASQIWEHFDVCGEDVWPFHQSARDALVELTPQQSEAIGNPNISHKELRQIVSSALANASAGRRQNLHDWIVCKWGGIRKKPPTTWAERLNDSKCDHETLISDLGTRRIASWSKVLAFTFPDRFAIYDSRTATSLNVVLEKLNIDYRFFMPPTRSALTRQTQQRLRPGRTNPKAYSNYLALLEMIVSTRKCSDIVEAEQTIFRKSLKVMAQHLV